MALGNRLRLYRERRGETLRQTAAAVEMDWAHLWRVEHGRGGCSDEKKVALAKHFNVPLTELFFVPEMVAFEATDTAEAR